MVANFYSPFIITNYLVVLLAFWIILFYLIIHFSNKIIEKRQKNQLLSVKNEVKTAIFLLSSVIIIFTVIGLIFYPIITPQNVTYGDLTLTGNFDRFNINITSDVSQKFIVSNGLINWFPIFYQDINNAVPQFNTSSNEMSYQKYQDIVFVFYANRTSKPIAITIKGIRVINESYGYINISDVGQTGNLFNLSVVLPDGKSSIEINRHVETTNITTINYRVTIVNNRNFSFSSRNLFLDNWDGNCKIKENGFLYPIYLNIAASSVQNISLLYMNFDTQNKTIDKFNFALECS